MSSEKWIVTLSLLAALGCGNYSNEDVDFQLGLPDRAELTAILPGQALMVSDSAEQYKLTRAVVTQFNAMADLFLGLIDGVRSFPPTERKPNARIWGPFPVDNHRGWQARVLIERSLGMPDRFVYFVQLRPAGERDGAWVDLFTGWYVPGLTVRRGKGQMFFETEKARAVNYPLGDLNGISRFTITHQRLMFPKTVTMDITFFPNGERVSYGYQEGEDGSGQMVFMFPTPQYAPLATTLDIRSRWTGMGAGRADVTVVKGAAAGANGTECWGNDTRATYIRNDFDAGKNFGDRGSCVYPDL